MKSLPILKEVRLAAFELIVIPGIFITSVCLIGSRKFAKKVRKNIDTIKGYHADYEVR